MRIEARAHRAVVASAACGIALSAALALAPAASASQLPTTVVAYQRLERQARAWVAASSVAYGSDWASLYRAFLDGSSRRRPRTLSFDDSSQLARGTNRLAGFKNSADTDRAVRTLLQRAAIDGRESFLGRVRAGEIRVDDIPVGARVIVPLSSSTTKDAPVADSAQFRLVVREYAPNLGSAAYGSANPFAVGGYRGQCTWFAWGRFYEVYGERLPCLGNAGGWLDHAGVWPTSRSLSAIRPGAVVVWRRRNPDYAEQGHVAFVEDVVDGTVYLNEANNHIKGHYDGEAVGAPSDRVSLSQLASFMGPDYEFVGFIFPRSSARHLPSRTTSVTLLSKRSLSELESQFAFGHPDLAGTTAGGATGNSYTGADRRIPGGYLVVERVTDGPGSDAKTLGVRISTAVTYTVWDALSFRGSAAPVAVRLSPPFAALQVRDLGFAVPFVVRFTPETQSSRFIPADQLQ